MKFRARLIFCLLCCVTATSPYAVTLGGSVTTATIASNRVDLALTSGAVARISLPFSDVVRVQFSPQGTFSQNPSGAVIAVSDPDLVATVLDAGDAIYLLTPDVTVVAFKSPLRMVILRPDGTTLLADAPIADGWDESTGLVFTQKLAPPGQRYRGLGFRAGPLDRRGRLLVMANTDTAAYSEFTDPLYVSIPFYIASDTNGSYGLYLDNAATPFFDLDSSGNGQIVIGALHGELDYYIIAGAQPADILGRYSALTGRMGLPPKWALGYQQSRFGYRSAQEFLDLAGELRTRKIPSDALWFDLHYEDNLQLFTWDPAAFPDPAAMNQSLRSLGFASVAIVDPIIHRGDRLWDFADQANFLLTDPSTSQSLVTSNFIGEVSWLDFSRQSAADWYRQSLTTFLTTGITAVWNDLNEPATGGTDAIYDFDGAPRSDSEARNLYALLETAQTHQALVAARPTERPWILSRSGFAGIQRYAANWGGDTDSTFEALRLAVQVTLSMALSGQPFFGDDVGGFLGNPTPELFIRWLAFSSFTPLFRNHSVNTSAPREPWQFGEPYLTMARQIIERRYALMPYWYTLAEVSSTTGSPMVAPLLYFYPDDPQAAEVDDMLMLGADLLIAPVLEAGATTRGVYLPGGDNWFSLPDLSHHGGGQTINVQAPLNVIPQFVRAGAIIPMDEPRQYTGEQLAAETLTFDIYHGPDHSFTLYEDDGISMAYQSGVFLKTRIGHVTDAQGIEISMAPVDGSWQPPARDIRILYQAVPGRPTSVTLDGRTLSELPVATDLSHGVQGWAYVSNPQRVVIRFPDSRSPRLVRLYYQPPA